MAEFVGTLIIVFVLIRLNLWGWKNLLKTEINWYAIFSSGLAAAATGVVLSYVGHDGSFRQAPAIVIAAALITIFIMWRGGKQ